MVGRRYSHAPNAITAIENAPHARPHIQYGPPTAFDMIVGSAVREPDPESVHGHAYRSPGHTRLVLGSSARAPLLISDAPWL